MDRRVVALACIALAACGERASFADGERAAPDLTRPTTIAAGAAVPVRVGEAGPAFRACQATGTMRSRDAGGAPLVVREGPFDSAAPSGRIAAGTRFWVCTRSIDQRWLGIVYADAPAATPEGEAALPPCGVSVPVPRGNYAGPCRSGWVTSAFVRLAAG